MPTISDRLLEVRTAQQLSVRDFAAELRRGGFKVSQAGVSKYERGASVKVPADYLGAVCGRFKVSPAWLLMGAGKPDDPLPDADAYAKGAQDALAPVVEAVRGALRRAQLAPEDWMERVERPDPEEVRGATAELLKKDRTEAQAEGGPPVVDRRHRPRRKRGAA